MNPRSALILIQKLTCSHTQIKNNLALNQGYTLEKKTTDNGKRLDSEDTRFLADSFNFARTFFCFLVKQKIKNLYPLLGSHEEIVLQS